MGNKDELKEIGIKNCTCYYFDDMIRDMDIDFENILFDEKSYKNRYVNILIYYISYETFMGAKRLRIRFDKINEFIKIYDGIRYLVLYDYKRYNAIYDRIKYLISEKVVLQIELIVILEESSLIHLILFLYKKY